MPAAPSPPCASASGRASRCCWRRHEEEGTTMAEVLTLKEAVAELVHDGDTVALEGFTHLIPVAAGQEIIRQGRRELTLVRMTPDIVYDQLIGAGCAAGLVTCSCGASSACRRRRCWPAAAPWPRSRRWWTPSTAAPATRSSPAGR